MNKYSGTHDFRIIIRQPPKQPQPSRCAAAKEAGPSSHSRLLGRPNVSLMLAGLEAQMLTCETRDHRSKCSHGGAQPQGSRFIVSTLLHRETPPVSWLP
jgi:hypothetical protein